MGCPCGNSEIPRGFPKVLDCLAKSTFAQKSLGSLRLVNVPRWAVNLRLPKTFFYPLTFGCSGLILTGGCLANGLESYSPPPTPSPRHLLPKKTKPDPLSFVSVLRWWKTRCHGEPEPPLLQLLPSWEALPWPSLFQPFRGRKIIIKIPI